MLPVPVDGDAALTAAVRRLARGGIGVTELSLRLPSLDEVFFTLTGRRTAREEDGGMTATLTTEPVAPVPAPTTEPGARPFRLVRHSLALAWRSLIKIRRTPEQLLDVTLQPVIFVVLFVYLLRRRDLRLARTTTCSSCCRRSWCRPCSSRR